MSRRSAESRRGAALITVLWLTAALAIIGFSVAAAVRGELGRAENSLDGARAELLARGAIDRMFFFLTNPPFEAPGFIPDYLPGQQRMYWRFPGGDVLVELLPESGKLNLNSALPQQIQTVLLAAGYPANLAQGLTEAILDWRTAPPGGVSPLDSYYLSLSPTFRPHHASFQRVEELLMIRGVTPHLYHGGRERIPGGGVIARPGLVDLFSVQGATVPVDINSAPPAVLASVGLNAGEIQSIVAVRRRMPYPPQALSDLQLSAGPALRVLRAGQDQAYTIKATARPRLAGGGLSDFRWTSSALVVYQQEGDRRIPRIRAWHAAAATDIPWPAAAAGAAN